jgi:uncharacterized membrane protein
VSQRKSFIESLFDISFNNFVAIRVIGILYIISVALISLVCLGVIFSSLASGNISTILGALVFTPLGWIFYVILIRIGLESLAAAIKTSENTAQMLEIMRNKQNPY